MSAARLEGDGRRGGGRFVNVSSGAAFGGVPDGSVYSMAKMGVVGLTRAMASEGKAVGIAANVISPSAKTRPPVPGSDPSPGAPSWPSGSTRGALRRLSRGSPTRRCPLTGEWFTVGGGHVGAVGLTVTEGFRRPRGAP